MFVESLSLAMMISRFISGLVSSLCTVSTQHNMCILSGGLQNRYKKGFICSRMVVMVGLKFSFDFVIIILLQKWCTGSREEGNEKNKGNALIT